ncbi:MAG: hypothetical protein FWG73_08850 [Planctomycetaceae bacterium]|nr:hypothetical protein [Planctomycetaceae bacterium]
MIHRLITFCLILGIAMLSGCSDAVQLRGTVTFEDGSPVGIGTVCFDSGSSIARGDLQSDGTYRLSTVNPGDGIPPGTYTVYLINTERGESVPRGDGNFADVIVQTVDPKFTTRASSEITVTVDKSTRTFDFEVRRYQGR